MRVRASGSGTILALSIATLPLWMYLEGVDFPKTSPNSYLSGLTALSIPFPQSGAGDWHLLHSFSGGPGALTVAGDANAAFVNTNDFLAASGVQECSGILRQAGIPVPADVPVFAASPQRAVVDLLVSHFRRGMERSYLQLEDYFDTPQEVERLYDFVRSEASSLPPDERQFVLSHVENLAAA